MSPGIDIVKKVNFNKSCFVVIVVVGVLVVAVQVLVVVFVFVVTVDIIDAVVVANVA